MDIQKFSNACEKIVSAKRAQNGIGTLGEKTLHAVLKNYFEPDETKHEVKVGRFFADIINEKGITEIQTRQFNKLRGKLKAFLEENIVTLVYPVAQNKWLIWIDQETGEATKRRRSPKRGNAYEIFPELYKIKNFLTHPNLRLCIALLDIEEYRLLNGWSHDRKKGSERYDRIPVGINSLVYINHTDEYIKLIPPDICDGFTSKDFAKVSGISIYRARTALNVLFEVGAVERTGKKGNSFIYSVLKR